MTYVTLFKKNDIICGYEIKGHAGYRPHGEDIVCAAISILGYTALNSLIEVANIDESSLVYTIIDEEGYMKVNLKEDIGYAQSQSTQIIFQTLIIGLRLLNEEYKEYISIDFEEVD